MSLMNTSPTGEPEDRSLPLQLVVFTCPDCGSQTRLSQVAARPIQICVGCEREIRPEEIEVLLDAKTRRIDLTRKDPKSPQD